MEYMTSAQAADKWNISDRRVRVLCREKRIPGVIEDRGAYLIPYDAKKPADGRRRQPAYSIDADYGLLHAGESESTYRAFRPAIYLKWENDVIAQIGDDYSVRFTQPEYNRVVEAYTHGEPVWSREQFEAFLQERIVSRDRRDIEKILFRCGLSSYDTIRIGVATKAVHAGDLLWITDDPNEKMKDAVTDVFSSVFLQRIDAEGDSVDTPEGFNIKRYGVLNGRYGIYKKRISPVTTDAESELAVYGIAGLMGIKCCPAVRVDDDTIFSQFEYDFAKEYIVHMRRLIEADGGVRGENEYLNLLSARPQYMKEFVQMMALDFVTRQDDRHLSNIAVKMSGDSESFYPLYDNGRSLFYEDSEETAWRACKNIELYSTSFGPSGTYYDHIREISESGIVFGKLVNTNIDEKEISEVLTEAGFKGYRLDAARAWICRTLVILKQLDNNGQ